MDDFFCKTVDINNIDNILSEIRPYVLDKVPNMVWGYNLLEHEKFINDNPIFYQFIKEYKLSLRRIAVIKIRQNSSNRIHVDYIDQGKSNIALNMCIENCANSVTRMFKIIKHNDTVSQSSLGFPFHAYELDEVEYVTEFNLEKPTLFNIAAPHQVVNNTNFARISISFRFHTDPISLMM